MEIGVLAAVSIFFLVYLFTSQGKVDQADGVITSINDNWAAEYMMELAVIKEDGNCPEGFKSAASYQFPGTGTYCECRSGLFSTGDLYIKSSCRGNNNSRYSSNSVEYGCTEKSIASKTLTIWNNRVMLCKKTEPTLKYKENFLIMKDDGTCPTDKIKCGLKTDESVCVPKTLNKCPISAIAFGTNPDPIKFIEEVKSPFGESYFVARGTGLPIVISKYEEYWPCVDTSLHAKTPDRELPYTAVQKNNCTKDERYSKISTMSEQVFFRNNYLDVNELQKLKWALPNIEYGLFTQAVVPLKRVCKDKIEQYQSFGKEVDESQSTMKALVIFSVIMAIIIGILACVSVCSLCSEESLAWPVRTAVAIILMAVAVGWMYYSYMQIQDNESSILSVANIECNDAFTNKAIVSANSNFIDAASNIKTTYIIGGCILLGFIVIVIGHFLIAKNSKAEKKKGGKQNQTLMDDSFGSSSDDDHTHGKHSNKPPKNGGKGYEMGGFTNNQTPYIPPQGPYQQPQGPYGPPPGNPFGQQMGPYGQPQAGPLIPPPYNPYNANGGYQ